MSKTKVLIATPIHRQPHPRMDAALQKVMATSKRAHCYTAQLRNESLISRARGTLLSTFIEHEDVEWLYFWDDDIEPVNVGGEAGNLIDMLLRHNKPIIGGLYSTRGAGGHCAGRVDSVENPRNPMPVRYLAGGSMLIHRRVIDQLKTAHPGLKYTPRNNEGAADEAWALFAPLIYDGEYLSEDFAFCQRALDTGYGVWADLDVQLLHWGEAPYGLIDMREGAK